MSKNTFHLKSCPVNPTLEYADSIVLPEGTDHIISERGGSTIDVCKWLARKFKIPHTAIPTTAGTGSEVTKYCVLMVDGKKTTFTDEAFIPTSYVLDPRLVVSLPRLHTLSSGLDAFSQALESYWSLNSTPESQSYAQMAINIIPKALIDSIETPDNERARADMLLGANLSGRAINITKTNVCHAISYPLTELYGIPHGIACSITLPYFSKKALKFDISEFFKRLDIPKYEFDKDKVRDIAIESEKLKDCPFHIAKDDIDKSLS